MKAGFLLIRFLKIISLLVFVLLLFVAYYYLPPQTAIRFDEFEVAETYVDKATVFYASGLVILLFNMALSVLAKLIFSVPVKLFAFPNRTYWAADRENQREFHEIIRDWLNSLVALVNIFSAFCLYALLQINTNHERLAANFAWLLPVGGALLAGWLFFLPIRLLIKKNGLTE